MDPRPGVGSCHNRRSSSSDLNKDFRRELIITQVLLIWIQLGVDGRNVAETDVVACSDTGEHAGHVVEENLDRALGWSLVLTLP